ncbi:MAG: alpha/beta hydrolase [Synechococcus sp.]
MPTVKTRRCRLIALVTSWGIGLTALASPALAAKDVALISGAFRRSIPVKDIEHLANTGEARGLLEQLLVLSEQDPENVAKLLNQKLDLPLVLTSRLINTRIGEAIIRRVGQILYPIYTPQPEVSIPALRAGVINGLHNSGDGLTAVDFLKAYPNEVLAVNLPALFSVIDKAQSISGLVQFFSDSPLDGLKEAKP